MERDLFFNGCKTSNEAKQRYQELSRVFNGQKDVLLSPKPGKNLGRFSE